MTFVRNKWTQSRVYSRQPEARAPSSGDHASLQREAQEFLLDCVIKYCHVLNHDYVFLSSSSIYVAIRKLNVYSYIFTFSPVFSFAVLTETLTRVLVPRSRVQLGQGSELIVSYRPSLSAPSRGIWPSRPGRTSTGRTCLQLQGDKSRDAAHLLLMMKTRRNVTTTFEQSTFKRKSL